MTRWAVAVTTAPRPGASYLASALRSIEAAGWRPGVVFAEPESPGGSPWPVETAARRLWPWPNFQRALRWCVGRSPAAVAIFQDDCLVAAGCREWIESRPEPWARDVGVASLYTAGKTEQDFGGPGWFEIPSEALPMRAYGAVAVVLGIVAARDLLANLPNPRDRTKTDYHIGTWCRARGLRFLCHSPSLARHVGEASAIRRGLAARGGRTLSRREAGFVQNCRELTP